MSAKPKINNSDDQNNGYDKDINFLPEEMKSKSGKGLPLDLKKQQSRAKEEKISFTKEEKKAKNWLKKFFSAIKPKPKTSGVKKRESASQPSPPKFVPSKKPNLQVDVRQKPPKPPSKENIGSQPAKPTARNNDVGKSKDDKEKLLPDSGVNAKTSPAISSEKQMEDKHVPFSSLKELMENEPVSSSEDFDVNLIPAELITADIKKNFIKRLFIAGVGSILLVIIFYAGVSILGAGRQSEISTVKKETEQLSGELDKAQDTLNKLSDFTKQAGLVNEVLQGQKKWSQLFALLEKETIPEVYYTSVAVSANNEVGLTLVAKSYHDLARQYVIFQSNPHIKEMSMGAATMDTEIWEEYLKELELSAERDSLVSEGGEEEVPEFKMPTFSQVQDLITVDSNFKFIYDFSQEEKNK